MGGRIVAYLALGSFFGFLFASGLHNRGARAASSLSQLCAASPISGNWKLDESAPSGAVVTAPVPSVCLNRSVGPEGEVSRQWYKLASLSDAAGANLRGLVVLPRKQNSNAVAYLVTEDGRAIPVFSAEQLRK